MDAGYAHDGDDTQPMASGHIDPPSLPHDSQEDLLLGGGNGVLASPLQNPKVEAKSMVLEGGDNGRDKAGTINPSTHRCTRANVCVQDLD